MTDLLLYTQSGPVKCSGCEAAKAKLLAAGIGFEERASTSRDFDAVHDPLVLAALHNYWWHNSQFPEQLPFLVMRSMREIWDADDLDDMEFGA